MIFCEHDFEHLRRRVREYMSEARFIHTLGVEKMAEYLSVMCAPEYTTQMRIAALLHDISKEYSDEEQMRLIDEGSVALDESDKASPQILHSFTAPVVIKRDFPELADEIILSAVGRHTIGSPDMSVTDEIIFLADFIEEGRSYDSCVALRKYVTDGMNEGATAENLNILHQACADSIDHTIKNILTRKKVYNPKNILTRDALLAKIYRKED